MWILAASGEVIAAWSAVAVATIGAAVHVATSISDARARKHEAAAKARAEQEAASRDAKVRDTEAALQAQAKLIEGLQKDNDRLRSGLGACEQKCGEIRTAWESERDHLRQQIAELRHGGA